MNSPALREALARESRRLAAALSRAAKGRPTGVHKARVSARRWRELSALLAPANAADLAALRREVRSVRRALGPVREVDVARELLARLAERRRWSTRAVALVDGALGARRDAAARPLVDVSGDVSPARLRAMVAAADAEGRRVADRLAALLRRRSAQFGDALAQAGTLYAAGPLHRARIAAKKLRYALEAAREAGVDTAGDVRQLRAAQSVLGEVHDYQWLQQAVQHVAGSVVGSADASLSAGLDRMSRDLEVLCRSRHARFVKMLPGLADTHRRAAASALQLVPTRARRMLIADGGRRRRVAGQRS